MDIQTLSPLSVGSVFSKKRPAQTVFQGAAPKLSKLTSDQIFFSGQSRPSSDEQRAEEIKRTLTSFALSVTEQFDEARAERRGGKVKQFIHALLDLSSLKLPDEKKVPLLQLGAEKFAKNFLNDDDHGMFERAIATLKTDLAKAKVIQTMLTAGTGNFLISGVRAIEETVESDEAKIPLILAAAKQADPSNPRGLAEDPTAFDEAVLLIATLKSEEAKKKAILKIMEDDSLVYRHFVVRAFSSLKSEASKVSIFEKAFTVADPELWKYSVQEFECLTSDASKPALLEKALKLREAHPDIFGVEEPRHSCSWNEGASENPNAYHFNSYDYAPRDAARAIEELEAPDAVKEHLTLIAMKNAHPAVRGVSLRAVDTLSSVSPKLETALRQLASPKETHPDVRRKAQEKLKQLGIH